MPFGKREGSEPAEEGHVDQTFGWHRWQAARKGHNDIDIIYFCNQAGISEGWHWSRRKAFSLGPCF